MNDMKKFGHYEVTAELGRGGMGVVYKGWEPSLNRKVAIKCLGEHLLNDEDLVERFTREAKATAALNNPNVIQIYFIGKEEGVPFFAMEYIEGQSLDDILKGGNSLSVKHAKNILKQACLGLAAAHQKELVHRDIKPANLMLTKDGTLKVVDFGIARTREYGDKLTNTGEFVGTPGYLSPEVCIGQEVDQRSDIFSLGIVFYEMLAGKVPFENDSPLGLMLEVVQSDIPDIRGLNKKVDKKTSFILNKMIAKSPDDRYQSCEEIIRDLGNIVDNQTISAIQSEAKTIDYSAASSREKMSDKITLPSAAAVTDSYLVPKKEAPKKGKSWIMAATLFAVLAAAGIGYYGGYLPIPGSSSKANALLVDENLMKAGGSSIESKSKSITSDAKETKDGNAEKTESNIVEGGGLMAGISNMLSGDDNQDVATINDSGNVETPLQDADTQLANTTSLQANSESSGIQIDVLPTDPQAKISNLEPKTGQTKDLSASIQDNLNTVAHNSTLVESGIAEPRTQVPPIHTDSVDSVAKTVIQKPKVKKAQPILRNKGVVVIAFGDPAIANPVEKILENKLKQQGIKVMNEQFISGMKQSMENGLDLAEVKSLIEKNGGQAMVIANVNYIGSQQLQYAGRSSELVNAQIDIDAYDIVTGDSIGNGFGTKINYTSINATDQASDAVMQYTQTLTADLKNKI